MYFIHLHQSKICDDSIIRVKSTLLDEGEHIMIEQNTNLLGKLESIEVNEQEQIYINKAIQQLKNEKQSEKIVIK